MDSVEKLRVMKLQKASFGHHRKPRLTFNLRSTRTAAGVKPVLKKSVSGDQLMQGFPLWENGGRAHGVHVVGVRFNVTHMDVFVRSRRTRLHRWTELPGSTKAQSRARNLSRGACSQPEAYCRHTARTRKQSAGVGARAAAFL